MRCQRALAQHKRTSRHFSHGFSSLVKPQKCNLGATHPCRTKSAGPESQTQVLLWPSAEDLHVSKKTSDHLITVCMACRNTGSDLQVHKSTAAGAVHISHTVSQIKYDAGGSSAPQPWWQQATMPQMLASAKFTGRPRQPLPLTDEQLRSLAPCEVVRNALPLKLANSLLKVLLADCETWVRGTWFMAGKQHSAPRRSAYYTLGSTQVKLA